MCQCEETVYPMASNPGPGELQGMLFFVVCQLLINWLEQLITQLTHRIPGSQQGADLRWKKEISRPSSSPLVYQDWRPNHSLFMFLYIYYFSSSCLSSVISIIHSLILPVIMLSCSPVMSLCFCLIWTLRLFPDSWHFPITSLASRFLEFAAAILICIAINSPLL